MLHFKIKELIAAKGYKFPSRFLMKQCGLPRNKVYNILNGKQKWMALDDISLICKKMDGAPHELMYWKQNPKDPLPEGHRCLTQMSPPDGDEDWNKLLTGLAPDDIEELRRLARKKKNKK